MFDDFFASIRTLVGAPMPSSSERSAPAPTKPKVGRPHRGGRKQVKAARKARHR